MNTYVTRSLSKNEFAKLFGIGRRKVDKLIRAGLLGAVDLGVVGRPLVRISPQAIAEFERTCAVRTAPTVKAKRPRLDIDRSIAEMLDAAE